MERFNYPNIQAVMDEDMELMHLLECESYGEKRDEQERMEQQKIDLEQERSSASYGE